jgi:UDP-arabinose 4-epimerase
MKPPSQPVLVTGGAGYIGSHISKALAAAGFTPIAFDNLSVGHKHAVQWGPLVEADLLDGAALDALFHEYKIDTVIHAAGSAYVGESVANPQKYFRNNISGSLNLLDSMVRHGVKNLVFSSSCTTYGVPQRLPIDETHPQSALSPYGETKLMVERFLHWYRGAYGLRSLALRYFNAAGADPDGQIGEEHDPETHLIPLVIQAALGGSPLTIFGDDYPTPDGTAIRDYIHVTDLADAHIRGLQYLQDGGTCPALNLGTGRGLSILEVIQSVERLSGRQVPSKFAPRREGDAAAMVADASRAAVELGWKPLFSDLDTLTQTAWRWFSRTSRQSS